jgi:signal transduction histidine kinase
MLSTLTIISIFTEIFATGILLAGAYTLTRRYLAERKRGDLFLGFVFLLFAVYVALTVASQMMYNLERPLSELIAIHKLINFVITATALFLWFYLLEKFGYTRTLLARILSLVLIVLVVGIFVSISAARVDLVYRRDVIEPIVNFSMLVPSKAVWILMWGILALLGLSRLPGASEKRRNLLAIISFSALLVVAAHACAVMYIGTAEAMLLLASWVITLFAVVGLLIGEVIPEGDKMALQPLNFFRTRILYKLILIFVLLIVILLEVTTLVTINISRDSLISAIKSHQRSIAMSISDKISYGGLNSDGGPNLSFIQKLVSEATVGKKIVYVVDGNGKIIAHPQESALGRLLGEVASIKMVLRGESGSLEYLSPLFIVPDDQVVGSFAPVSGLPFGVVVEEPKAYAYKEIRRVETNSLIFVITGIILAIIVGMFFARSIERPIKDVIDGTEAVRKGNLSYRINIASEDEIGRLASAFNQMTVELKETQDHLVSSEKLAALGTMAAGMAHEIKNPLVSLRTFTQLLQQKFDDAEYRRKFSAIVPQEIERINKIAESLLKFGRPTRPELAKVNVNKILEEVLELLDNECKRNDIRITTKYAEMPEITGDVMQLSQAFVNIVLNAIQAMSRGGELTVKTDIGEVIRLGRTKKKGELKSEGAYKEGSWGEAEEDVRFGVSDRPVSVVFVEVTDTGVGIEESKLRSLFDPFYTTKIGGTGMGLPITLRIIEDHKGSIKVRSQVEKGTTFIVTLPQKLEEV